MPYRYRYQPPSSGDTVGAVIAIPVIMICLFFGLNLHHCGEHCTASHVEHRAGYWQTHTTTHGKHTTTSHTFVPPHDVTVCDEWTPDEPRK